MADWPIILADRILSDGRHVVLGDVDGPHHLWLRDTLPGHPLAYVIVRDPAIEARRRAAWRLDRRLAGAPPLRRDGAFRPTPFQRRRLELLLDILDMLQAPPSTPRPTSHEIARRLIYPGMTIGRGMEWKSSTERRRTQRLIDEALALMHGGYRTLLRGAVGGRQKSAA
ncbi:DUF2285 domain-containing protein [Sphingomonas oryzagri]